MATEAEWTNFRQRVYWTNTNVDITPAFRYFIVLGITVYLAVYDDLIKTLERRFVASLGPGA
jgi:hypothetical protein